MWRRWCRLPCCWPRQGPGLQGRTGRASRVASQPAAPASRVLSRSATTRADGLPGGSPVRPRAPGATPPYPAFCRPAGSAAARTSGQQQPGLGERHGSICRGGQLLPATRPPGGVSAPAASREAPPPDSHGKTLPSAGRSAAGTERRPTLRCSTCKYRGQRRAYEGLPVSIGLQR
jgi:hypothetical protein